MILINLPFVQLVAGVSMTAPPPLYTSSTQGSSDGRSLVQLEEKVAVVYIDACRIQKFHGFHLFRIYLVIVYYVCLMSIPLVHCSHSNHLYSTSHDSHMTVN